MTKIRRLAAALTVILISAASATGLAQKLPFQWYSVRDGLPSNYITDIEQDREGYLWIATPDGIARFDGITWKTWTEANGLPDNFAYCIAVAPVPASAVYIGTNRGLCRVRGRRLDTVRLGSSARNISVRDLSFDTRGALWIGTAEGLFRHRAGTTDSVRSPGLPKNCMRVLAARDGTVWILSPTGLYRYEPGTGRTIVIDTLRGVYANANFMYMDRKGTLFVCSRDSSLLEFRGTTFRARHDFRTVQPYAMTTDDHGRAWIATSGGLFLAASSDSIDVRTMIRYGSENGLLTDALNYACFDNEKTLWFGSEGRGMVKLEDSHIVIFDGVDLTGKGVSDPQGHVWLSSRSGLWEIWDTGTGWRKKHHPVKAAWGPGFPFHLDVDRHGRLWAALEGGGITCFDISRKNGNGTDLRVQRHVLPAPGFPTPGSFVFAIDSADRLCYVVSNQGLVVVETEPSLRLVKHLKDSARVPLNIYSMYVDVSGTLWCGGQNGKLSGITFQNDRPSVLTLGADDGLAPSVIRAILRRSDNMWIGSSAHGFGLIEHGKVIPYTTRNGMLADRVWCFAEGIDGRIWIGTQRGLASVKGKTPRIFEYNQQLTDSPVYSCGIRPDGSLWAATRFGVTIHDYLRSSTDTLPPNITVTRVFVNGVERPAGRPLFLSSVENSCRFEFTTVTTRRPEEMRFEYRLEGLDTAWQQTRERSVRFASLVPGEYVFLVRAVRPNGVRSAKSARIPFEIARPFWQQAWFILLAVLLIGAVIYLPLRTRVKRLLEIERIRARIAADLHDDIGSGLTRIALMTEVLMRQNQAAQREIEGQPPYLREPLERIGTISRELVDGMTDVVWSIDPRNDAFSKLTNRIKVHAVGLCEAREIALHFDVPDMAGDPSPGSDVSRALLLVAKEALNNIVKHAQAQEIRVTLCRCERDWLLRIADDGIGFDEDQLSRINGLENMRSRVRKTGGSIEITSAPGSGTVIEVHIPIVG